MEKLVEQIQPASRLAPSEYTSASQESPSASAGDSEPLFSASGSDQCTPASASFDTDPFAAGSPNLPTGSTAKKLASVRHALFDIYPTQHDVEIILANPTGNKLVENLLYTEHDVATGRAASPSDVARRPGPLTHPVIIAKRLLHLTLCLSHMVPSFDYTQLDAQQPVAEISSEIISTVGALVCLDDELVCCAEGLEVMALHMMCQFAVGNLRKSWVSLRRALSLGDLMGLHTPSRLAALPYCDPASDPAKRPLPAVVWFQINDFERYLSLLLGLPTVTRDEDLKMMGLSTMLSRAERLGVAHGLVAGRIIERNLSRMDDYMMTLDVDLELNRAADEMPASWWAGPDGVDSAFTDEESVRQTGALVLQTRHHSLLIMLHLPFLLRARLESRFAPSMTACLAASREVLSRYARFRTLHGKHMSCRHMDFFGLVASMTLVLGYLGGRGRPEQRITDRGLVEVAREKMAEQARVAGDRMTGEAAEVVGQLMPIIDRGVNSCAEAREAVKKGLSLRIPYLGTVNIGDEVKEGCCPGELAGEGEASEGIGNGPYHDDGGLQLSVDTGLIDAAVLQAPEGVPGMDMDPMLLANPLMQPGLTADAEDWSFQGIDTTYWSLLNGNFVQGL